MLSPLQGKEGYDQKRARIIKITHTKIKVCLLEGSMKDTEKDFTIQNIAAVVPDKRACPTEKDETEADGASKKARVAASLFGDTSNM